MAKKISKWRQGVAEYVGEFKRFVKENKIKHPKEKHLLNGAEDWHDYSWGGKSLIYNQDIAKRLATKSEIKKLTHKDGTLAQKPNKNEEWLDTQARALTQASSKYLASRKVTGKRTRTALKAKDVGVKVKI